MIMSNINSAYDQLSALPVIVSECYSISVVDCGIFVLLITTVMVMSPKRFFEITIGSLNKKFTQQANNIGFENA